MYAWYLCILPDLDLFYINYDYFLFFFLIHTLYSIILFVCFTVPGAPNPHGESENVIIVNFAFHKLNK